MSDWNEPIAKNCYIRNQDNFFGHREYGFTGVIVRPAEGNKPKVTEESKTYRTRKQALDWLKKNDTELRELEWLRNKRNG